jgi:hypothetical protein
LRGGSWNNNWNNARSGVRNNNNPNNTWNNSGFRVVGLHGSLIASSVSRLSPAAEANWLACRPPAPVLRRPGKYCSAPPVLVPGYPAKVRVGQLLFRL